MHVAVLTGGGDVPGLNALLAALAQQLHRGGHKLTGIKRGWHGLVAVEPGDATSEQHHTCQLTPQAVRGISGLGGTVLHSSRTNPLRMPSGPNGRAEDQSARVIGHLESLGINVLLPIGGDDTLGYGAHLSGLGVPVIGLPKTMDNDVGGTDVCLGFATCVARTVQYLGQLRTTAASHERLLVVEVMGRNSGASCLWPALLADADRALIAEVPFDPALLAHLLQEDRAASPAHCATVVVSEGAAPLGAAVFSAGSPDMFGHRKLGGIGAWVAADLASRTGCGVSEQRLGYLVRSGPPDAMDLLLAHGFASTAASLVNGKQYGRLVGIIGGRHGHTQLSAAATPTAVDVARCYDPAALRPRLESVAGCGLWPTVLPRAR